MKLSKITLSILTFTITVSILFVFSCKKTEIGKENAKKPENVLPENKLKSGSRGHEIDTSEIEFVYASKVNDLNTDLFEVSNNMIYFDSLGAFNQFMEGFVNKSDTVVVEFINSVSGFNSLRGYYQDQFAQDNVDDLELESERIPDPYFEAVLNDSKQIRIEDTVYQYIDDYGTVLKFLVNYYGEIDDLAFDTIRLKNDGIYNCQVCNSEDEDCHEKPENERICCWDSKHKEFGKKWVDYYIIYGSIGHKAVHYKKNIWGNWKRKKRPYIATIVDKYYQVRFRYPSYPHGTYIIKSPLGSNEGKIDKNSINVVKILGWNAGGRVCCVEFGRTHNWSYNSNSDKYGDLTWECDVHVDQTIP